MIKNLFDNENAIFMGAKRSPDDCAIGIFGVNYDGTCSFKPGARFGPEAIRQVSSCLEKYCPKLNKDLEDIMYVDFGSILIDKNDSKSVIESVKLATNYLINRYMKHPIYSYDLYALKKNNKIYYIMLYGVVNSFKYNILVSYVLKHEWLIIRAY